jgi:SAM-dependent methyltransferase
MIQKMKKIIQSFEFRMRFYRSIPENARLLDIGCGDGQNGNVIRSMHPDLEIFGVDIIEEKQAPPFYSYKRVDLETDMLPYPDNSFERIIFRHVIEHLNSPLRLGPEIYRVLRPGGKIYIEAPNWTSMFVPSFGFRRSQHGPFNFYDDPTHIRPWSRQSIYEFLSQSCNLNVERTGSLRNWVRLPFDPLIILVGFITARRSIIASSLWNLYGWCIYGVGRK